MALQNTEDIYRKYILFLYLLRDYVFSKESFINKLLLSLIIYITIERQTTYLLHLFLDFQIHTVSSNQIKILFKVPPVFIIRF